MVDWETIKQVMFLWAMADVVLGLALMPMVDELGRTTMIVLSIVFLPIYLLLLPLALIGVVARFCEKRWCS